MTDGGLIIYFFALGVLAVLSITADDSAARARFNITMFLIFALGVLTSLHGILKAIQEVAS